VEGTAERSTASEAVNKTRHQFFQNQMPKVEGKRIIERFGGFPRIGSVFTHFTRQSPVMGDDSVD